MSKRETSLSVITKMVNSAIAPIEASRDLLSQNLKTKMDINDDKGAIDCIEKLIRTYVSKSGYERISFAIDNITLNLENVKTKNVMDSIDYLTSVSKHDGSEEIKKQLKEFPAAKHPNVHLTHDVLVLYGKEKIDIDDIRKYVENVQEYTGINMMFLHTLILKRYPNFNNACPIVNNGNSPPPNLFEGGKILPPLGCTHMYAQVVQPMPTIIPEVDPIQLPYNSSQQPPLYTPNSPTNGAPFHDNNHYPY